MVMEMQKHMSFLVLVYALSVLSFLKFGCGSCDESEKQALLLLKESLTDEQAFNCLSSWVGDDCCAWYGIGCNNITGHVLQLDLSQCYLTGNHLAGRIPDKIGKLGKLEFLDLSRNELYGPIPQSLSDLNFLSRLNLSFNDLSGRIPTGNQLQTLDNPSIYAGNNQLCGRPIQKPCTSHNYNETNSDSDDGHVWFYAGIGPGLLVGFLGFCGSLHFIKSGRYLYFQTVEKAFDKLAIEVALLRRKLHNKQT